MNHTFLPTRCFFLPQTGQYSLIVLAGKTGSGKTELLRSLYQQGFPVVDLEDIAQHSGSAFGKLTQTTRTTTTSDIIDYLEKKTSLYEPVVFTECKAGSLGNIIIPEWFTECMKRGFIIHLDTPFNQRLERLVNNYKNVSIEKFSDALDKLKGKIEADIYTEAKHSISKGNYRSAIEKLLLYYDNSNKYKYYIDHAAVTINTDGLDEKSIIDQITNTVLENHPLFFQSS